MKHKKLKSFLVAALMLATFVPCNSLQAVAAGDKPELSFISGEGGDPYKAYVITGRSTGIRETVPDGYLSQGITIAKTESGSYTSGISIEDSLVLVEAGFNPGTGTSAGKDSYDPKNDPDKYGVYTINGNYYARLATGDVLEYNANKGTMSGTVQSTTSEAITKYSTIKLKCDRREDLNSPPQFSIVAGSAKGAFEDFDKTDASGNKGQVSVEEYTQDASKTKVLRLKIFKGNKVIEVVLNPKMVYSYETDDTGKEILDNSTPPKPILMERPDNYIREGTTFELIFRMPNSEPLFLTVMTPQNAMGRIENQIRQSDGRLNSSFIRMEEQEDLNYITKDFDLRSFSSQFNARFKVEWTWEPANAADKDVIRLSGGNGDWQKAVVGPKEDNVKGKLKAKVYYEKPGGGYQESKTAAIEKDVEIRGIGKPVAVTQVSTVTYDKTADNGSGGKGKDVETPCKTDKLPGAQKMDAYHGDITEYQLKPAGPYQYNLLLNMGAKNGAASFATVTATGDTGAVVIRTQVKSEAPMDYTFGAQIPNPNADLKDSTTAGLVNLSIIAQQFPPDTEKQSVTLTFRFFIPDRSGAPVESSHKFTITLNVEDSTPSQDSSLASLTIMDQDDDVIEYPFASNRYLYSGPSGMIHIPWKAKEITFTPVLSDHRGASADITIQRFDMMGNEKGDPSTVTTKDGKKSKKFTFTDEDVGIVNRIVITVPSQDPREEFWSTYTMEIMRDPPSDDDTLKAFGLYYETDEDLSRGLLPDFDPEVQEYKIQVPYSTSRLRVKPEANHERAKITNISPELKGAHLLDKNLQWLTDMGEKFLATDNGILDLTVTVQAENTEKQPRVYTVHIEQLDPNNDPSMADMKVLNTADEELPYRPAFTPETNTYYMDIPFSVSDIKLVLTPTDENVADIQIYDFRDWAEEAANRGKPLYSKKDKTVKQGAATSAIPVLSIDKEEIRDIGYHAFYIVVTAEDSTHTQVYELRVQREEPSDDASLKTLVLRDQEAAQIKTFAFHPDETSYELQVPFETTGIDFTPTTNHPGATIRIEEGHFLEVIMPYMVKSGNTSKMFKLSGPETPKTFDVIVTAEDSKTVRTYSITVTRDKPSSDARLKGLQVDNVEGFTPLFVSNKTDYEANVVEGAPGVIITATANHPGATIRIDGIVVESGSPSDLIELIEVEQEIEIEVTAQDGETKIVYKVDLRNENLIEKTSNADLKNLTVNYGQMTPQFQPAVTEYEVTVTEKTWSVDIIPRVADSLATVQVFSGTKEIGDYNGNYAQALEDGENAVTVKVTSPDKTVTKDYSLTIFRNEEEKLKNLTPLDAEDIDFENSEDVILVKIEEYPRVNASVFNTLKEYPQKTIVFQGNDYSLTFRASELTRIIPQATIYDFRMSFTSPDEEDIYDLIDSRSRNDDIINKAVLMYFDYHGSLPGPATLNLSLGRKYANDTLYWHYYNRERERIDYYGSLKSNNKGTVAVLVDHFSTYIVTPDHRIAGSEDKAGVIDELGISGLSDVLTAGSKVHPYTGTQEEQP